jgi:AcrR family transcriptional regulator
MGRTRAAIAAGTAECIRRTGARKTTMIDIAATAGIAKGTLYNHVRTRTEAYQLLAEAEVARLVQIVRDADGPAEALRAAGEAVATHPVLRALAESEPGALAIVALPGPLTDSGRDAVSAALIDAVGAHAAPLALRWLTGLMFDPGDADDRAAEATSIAASVTAPVTASVVSPPVVAVPVGSADTGT